MFKTIRWQGSMMLPGYNSSTNRYLLGGTSYDGIGNVLNDTFYRYTWDAEGKNLSTSGSQTWNFTYDAFGHKVEWLLNGSYHMSYITIGRFKLQALGQTVSYSEYPFPGGSLSSLNGGATGVQIADWQGTVRGFFNYTGGVVGSTGAHAPFGEAYAYAGGHPGSFTGQQNDGNMSPTTYYFPERQYPSSQGRWLTPDPAGISAVDPSNPQSWNRYAYVLNNPLSATDPLGLYCNWGNGQWDDLDGGATEEDCTNQGGKWIDGMSPSEILEQLQEQGTPLFQTEGWGTTGPGDSSVESSALGDADAANNGKSICSSANGKTIPVNS